MAERAGLENRRWGNLSASSNLAPSAKISIKTVMRGDLRPKSVADLPESDFSTSDPTSARFVLSDLHHRAQGLLVENYRLQPVARHGELVRADLRLGTNTAKGRSDRVRLPPTRFEAQHHRMRSSCIRRLTSASLGQTSHTFISIFFH